MALVAVPGTVQAAATRAEFVVQAEPICGMTNEHIGRLNARFRALRDKGQFRKAGKVLGRTAIVLTASIADIRAITPPPGDEQTVASWLALIDGVAANNRRMGRAEAHRKPERVKGLQRSNARLHKKAHALVADWGFQSCA